MSLCEVVFDIAKRMEEEASEMDNGKFIYDRSTRKTIVSFANELKSAAKASEGVAKTLDLQANYNPVDAFSQNRSMIEAARNEFKGKVQKIGPTRNSEFIDFADTHEERLVCVVGGSIDGDHILIPGNLQVGGELTSANGEVFKLGEDSMLHYVRLAKPVTTESQIIIPGKA